MKYKTTEQIQVRLEL